jgi:hypothetical protein
MRTRPKKMLRALEQLTQQHQRRGCSDLLKGEFPKPGKNMENEYHIFTETIL